MVLTRHSRQTASGPVVIPAVLCVTGVIFGGVWPLWRSSPCALMRQSQKAAATVVQHRAFCSAASVSFTTTCGNPYVSSNNVITGIKVWEGISLQSSHVGSLEFHRLLNRLVRSADGVQRLSRSLCSWQELGNPIALQYVQSMEIDSKGRMWI